MSEFYKAAAVGLKPEFTFEINDFEYENENYLRYPSGTGTVYTIIRAPKRGEMRELVCTTLTGVDMMARKAFHDGIKCSTKLS